MANHDRRLGMGSPITRRDFLNGVAIGIGGAMAGWMSPDLESLVAQGSAGTYPPALTGLRGSHPGSFEALHSMRDGAFWKTAPTPQATGEEYDLVVVGAGISGLAAAHFFRKSRPAARILLLDNHDDFGGHAKRNEFVHNGRTYLGYGGTQSIDSPAPYSAVSKALIAELGIDVVRYSKVLDSGALGFPGFSGMGLDPGPGPGQNYDSISHPDAGDYYFHFPDGNASIARLLVRRLVPAAIPGSTADDVVTARADYSKLDDPGSAVRIRLSSFGDASAPLRTCRSQPAS